MVDSPDVGITADDLAAHRIYHTLSGPRPYLNPLARLIRSSYAALADKYSPEQLHAMRRSKGQRARRQHEWLASNR